MPPGSARPGIGAGIGVVLFALAFLAPAVWMFQEQQRILKNWPEVTATGARAGVVPVRKALSFRPAVEFRYSLAGREYTSNPAGTRARNYAWAQHQVDAYAPGTRHAIRYNPDDPATVRFDAGLNFESFGIAAVLGLLGLAFLPLGLVLLRSATRVTHVPCEACGVMREAAWKFCADCGVPAPE